MSSVVPRNALQQRMSEACHQQLAPDPYAETTMPCIISKVYDTETIQEEGVPEDVAGYIASHPGWLHAEVTLLDRFTKYILPFKEPEEFIYSVYGNRVLLEGRLATICYRNLNPQNGQIILQKNREQKHLPLATIGQVLDIGALV
jgi:hypothetical protein